MCFRTKSVLTMDCNASTVAVVLQATHALSENFPSQPSSFRCFIIRMKGFLSLYIFGALLATIAQGATSFELAAKATNDLGVDLHRQLATGDENLCISPY